MYKPLPGRTRCQAYSFVSGVFRCDRHAVQGGTLCPAHDGRKDVKLHHSVTGERRPEFNPTRNRYGHKKS